MTSLSIRKQIYLAVGSVLTLLVVLAGLSYFATSQLAGIFGNYKETSDHTLIANQLFEDVFDAQFAALGYRLSASQDEIDTVQSSVQRIAEGQKRAKQIFAESPEALEKLWRIGKFTEQYQDAFAQMITLHDKSDQIVADLGRLRDGVQRKLNSVMDHAFLKRDITTIYRLGLAQQDLTRGLASHIRYLAMDRNEDFEDASIFLGKAAEQFELLHSRIKDPLMQQLTKQTIDDIKAYRRTTWRNRDVMTMHNDMRDKKLDRLGPQIKKEAEDLITLITDEQRALGVDGANRTALTLLLVAALSVSALVIGSVLAVSVARRISRKIRDMAETMTDLANGNLDVVVDDTQAKHELGLMARALEVFKVNAIELKERLDKERELLGMQRQFVSMVSHEFRTPLAIIDSHAQRVLRRSGDNLPELAVKGLGKIRNAVSNLMELMESVLATARLEEGRIQIETGPCALRNLVEEVSRNYGDLYADRRIHLDLDRLPDKIVADTKLLRQVFSNLLSNAIKYSPGKENIWLEGKARDSGEITIDVRDEGVGIPFAEQEKLFSRFFRASTSSGISGTGIGLHLVMHLVQLHEGSMEVESVEGEGTTFRVVLPAKLLFIPELDALQSTIEAEPAPLAYAAGA